MIASIASSEGIRPRAKSGSTPKKRRADAGRSPIGAAFAPYLRIHSNDLASRVEEGPARVPRLIGASI